jgi:hypothetical protein
MAFLFLRVILSPNSIDCSFTDAVLGSDVANSFPRVILGAKCEDFCTNSGFLFWLNFSSWPTWGVKSPKQKPDQLVFNVLMSTLRDLQADYNATTDPNVRKQCARIFQFILQEIKTNFSPSHLTRFNEEIAAHLLAQSNETDTRNDSDDDSINRGVVDL